MSILDFLQRYVILYFKVQTALSIAKIVFQSTYINIFNTPGNVNILGNVAVCFILIVIDLYYCIFNPIFIFLCVPLSHNSAARYIIN